LSSTRKPDTSLAKLIAEYDLRQLDVARHAGIDNSTLSILLAKEPLDRIRSGTRVRLQRAIEAARDEHDLIAKSARAWLREQIRQGLLPKHMSPEQIRQVAAIVRSVAVDGKVA
jgi:DNA-binding LacI/PurR family transcriptional regulator